MLERALTGARDHTRVTGFRVLHYALEGNHLHLIVEAMPEILRQRPDVTLLISRHREDVDYATKLRQRVSELGIEGSVRFIEPVAYDDMPGLLAATSVVVSVPFSDGLPQTLFECLAAGTPIVLGRLVALRDTEDLVDGYVEGLSNFRDEIVRWSQTAYFVA